MAVPVSLKNSGPRFPPSVVAQRKGKILVAEDSADSLEMMTILLETKGYEVVSAGDGLRAVDEALKRLPDLVLLDLALPGIDGLGVTRELRLHTEFQETPIIVVSGHDPARYRQAALEAGCNDFWSKPINFEKLDRMLDEIISPQACHEHAH